MRQLLSVSAELKGFLWCLLALNILILRTRISRFLNFKKQPRGSPLERFEGVAIHAVADCGIHMLCYFITPAIVSKIMKLILKPSQYLTNYLMYLSIDFLPLRHFPSL